MKTTWEQYQELEAASEFRLEFVNGDIYTRAPSTANHCRIVGSIGTELHHALKGSPYEPFMAGMKLRIQQGTDDLGYYPDVMVLDDNPADNDPLYCTSPRILFEGLSSSTRRVDACEKLGSYLTEPFHAWNSM